MKTLRSMVRLRWWLLAWFALSVGAAVASPIFQPKVTELVCSSAGTVKLLVHSDEGTVEFGAVGMDCPMCLLGAAVPVATQAPCLRCCRRPFFLSSTPAHLRWLPWRHHRRRVRPRFPEPILKR